MLSKWDSFISKTIRYFDGSDWSHVGLVVEVSEKHILIFESNSNGTKYIEYTKEEIIRYIANNNMKFQMLKYPKDVDLTTSNLKDVCNKYLNKSYGWLNYIFLIPLMFMKKMKMKVEVWKILMNSDENPFPIKTFLKGFICSELLVRVLYDLSDKKINFERVTGKPFEITTPGDVDEFLDEKW